MQRGAVGRFLLILGALYRVHANSFSVVSETRGRDRLYFSDNLKQHAPPDGSHVSEIHNTVLQFFGIHE